jgi:hypothetical protein
VRWLAEKQRQRRPARDDEEQAGGGKEAVEVPAFRTTNPAAALVAGTIDDGGT